jgi:glyoxylase-like metal-dependent hydrolase (beta-lactamase superfamily II)
MAISYGKDATIRPALREGKMNEIVPDVLTWSRGHRSGMATTSTAIWCVTLKATCASTRSSRVKPFQGAQIDDSFDVGERIGPLQVIGIPGKSPGEVELFWQERNLLIVGDAVIGNPPGRYGLLPEKVIDDPLQLKQSLQAMLALDFDTLLMGDGSSIVSHGKDRLKELLASFHD